jgi:hypothetical protein
VRAKGFTYVDIGRGVLEPAAKGVGQAA